jgi:hypothetical protein
MSRHSLARALFLLFTALLVWSTVTPAEAKPRRYSGEILREWKICRNGAELTIGATQDRVNLIVTSPTHPSGGKRVLATIPALRLDPQVLKVWVLWDIPTKPTEVVDDIPDTPPNELAPDVGTPIEYQFSKTVTVRWQRRAGRTVRIALGPADGSTPRPATYRVSNCLLLPSDNDHADDDDDHADDDDHNEDDHGHNDHGDDDPDKGR